MFAAGTLPLGLTISYVQLERRLRKRGVCTTGVVSSIKTRVASKGPAIDTVTISYDCHTSGHTYQSSIVTMRSKYKRGQEVVVRYLPDAPTKIVVGEKVGYWPMLILTTLVFLFVIYVLFQLAKAGT